MSKQKVVKRYDKDLGLYLDTISTMKESLDYDKFIILRDKIKKRLKIKTMDDYVSI